MNTLVISPHPDDEVLGCGGTLLKRKENGTKIGWIIMTTMKNTGGWSTERLEQRKIEISMIRQKLGIEMKDLFQLDYMATFLDQIPMREMVGKMHNAFEKFQPNEILLPHSCDVHSDHRVCYEVVTACTKRFRCPSIERVMCYEVMSPIKVSTEQMANLLLVIMLT